MNNSSGVNGCGLSVGVGDSVGGGFGYGSVGYDNGVSSPHGGFGRGMCRPWGDENGGGGSNNGGSGFVWGYVLGWGSGNSFGSGDGFGGGCGWGFCFGAGGGEA